MNQIKSKLVFLLAIFFVQSIHSDYLAREEVSDFIDYMNAKHDFDRDLLNNLLGEANHQERVIRIMNKQPEGTMTWERYKSIMVNDSRISAGEVFIEQHKSDLLRAESVYGVPAEIIASIIGIETRYGRIKGNIRVIDSLANESITRILPFILPYLVSIPMIEAIISAGTP